MISVVTVNFHSEDFIRLQAASLKKHLTDYEHIVVDNGSDGSLEGHVIHSGENKGHGAALDVGIREAKWEYILVLDADAHLLSGDWVDGCIQALEEYKIIGAKGGDLKPYRPCVSFFKWEYFIGGGHTFENIPVSCKGGFMTIDVGVFFALRTLHDGYKIQPFEYGESVYKDVWGETYYFDSKPCFYHNWYGSRFYASDEVDGLKKPDFQSAKTNLFNQVNDILS